ncbi:hypothetical protein L917_20280, partial [Phytophthora nicotianae]
NYPEVFTPEFARGTKSDLTSEYHKSTDALVESWLEEKYPGPLSQQRQIRFWYNL